MVHAFESELAELVGVNAALIYYHLEYYCNLKRDAGLDIYEGKAWTYCSLSQLCSYHPYMSEHAIRRSLKVLLEKGYIVRRHDLNKVTYDRTFWYSVCGFHQMDMLKSAHGYVENVTPICRNQQMDMLKSAHGCVENDTWVCRNQHNNTNITTNTTTNTNRKETKAKKRSEHFTPPTDEEVKAYCQEKGFDLDAERFVDYYTANGWKVGKNPMKDWKAAVRSWVRRDKERRQKSKGLPFDEFLTDEEAGL